MGNKRLGPVMQMPAVPGVVSVPDPADREGRTVVYAPPPRAIDVQAELGRMRREAEPQAQSLWWARAGLVQALSAQHLPAGAGVALSQVVDRLREARHRLPPESVALLPLEDVLMQAALPGDEQQRAIWLRLAAVLEEISQSER